MSEKDRYGNVVLDKRTAEYVQTIVDAAVDGTVSVEGMKVIGFIMRGWRLDTAKRQVFTGAADATRAWEKGFARQRQERERGSTDANRPETESKFARNLEGKRVKAILKRVGEPALCIDADLTYEFMSATVGGYLQMVPIVRGIEIVCNEDGMFAGPGGTPLPQNAAGYLGDILMVALDNAGECRDMTEQELHKGLGYLQRYADVRHSGRKSVIITGEENIAAFRSRREAAMLAAWHGTLVPCCARCREALASGELMDVRYYRGPAQSEPAVCLITDAGPGGAAEPIFCPFCGKKFEFAYPENPFKQ